MVNAFEKRYAELLVNYCLDLQAGEHLYLRSTLLAEPLVREIYALATKRGCVLEMDLTFDEKQRIYYQNANDEMLIRTSKLQKFVFSEFDAFLFIRAPYNLRELQGVDKKRVGKRTSAQAEIQKIYFERTARREMKRTLCQYPTHAAAQAAGMSLSGYQRFVENACFLTSGDPVRSWSDLRQKQQVIVDYLNKADQIHYRGEHIDVVFSTKDRTWMNSDGRTNMPSGEVFTAPIEDSVKGKVHFSYPGYYMGERVLGVTLWIEEGEVVKWEAQEGEDVLDQVFSVEGARRFGEVAIGTNYNIQQATGNILFDEKIGGSVHMAVGQSYLETGGKNHSTIHWDLITDMKKDGEIFVDGDLIYKKGQFLI